MEIIPIVSLDTTHEKALNIAMNKISGEWDTKKLESLLSDLKAEDFDVSLTGFDSSEIGLMLGVEDEIVQDEVPEVGADAPTICQRGELWQLGRHRLLCGSSTDKNDVAQLMDGQHSKLLFTSPPYSDMRTYNGDKELSVESIAQFIPCYEPFTSLQAVNLGIQRKDGEVYPYWDTYIETAKATGLKLLAWNVWDKLTCGSVGQQRAMIPIRHEWVFCFGKEPVTVNPTWRKKEASIYSGGRYNKIRQADGSFRIARRGNETGAFKKMESLRTATMASSTRRCSIMFKRSLLGARRWDGATAARAAFRQSWYAATAAASSARRSGIPQTNIAV